MDPKEIFLSYNRKDSNFVMKLVNSLKAANVNIWLDQINIERGERWDQSVQNALKQCKIFIVILSPYSVSSENVLDEVNFAINAGKKIIPLLIRKCEVPFRLERFQYIDFTKNYQQAIGQLFSDLNIPHKKNTGEDNGRKKSISKKLILAFGIIVIAAIFFLLMRRHPDNTLSDTVINSSDTSINNIDTTNSVKADSTVLQPATKADSNSFPHDTSAVLSVTKEIGDTLSVEDTSLVATFKKEFVGNYTLRQSESNPGYGKAQIIYISDSLFEFTASFSKNIKEGDIPHTLVGSIKSRFRIVSKNGYGWTMNPHSKTWYPTNPLNEIEEKKLDVQIKNEANDINEINLSKFEVTNLKKYYRIYIEIYFTTNTPHGPSSDPFYNHYGWEDILTFN